jgi:hypothetical protein
MRIEVNGFPLIGSGDCRELRWIHLREVPGQREGVGAVVIDAGGIQILDGVVLRVIVAVITDEGEVQSFQACAAKYPEVRAVGK